MPSIYKALGLIPRTAKKKKGTSKSKKILFRLEPYSQCWNHHSRWVLQQVTFPSLGPGYVKGPLLFWSLWRVGIRRDGLDRQRHKFWDIFNIHKHTILTSHVMSKAFFKREKKKNLPRKRELRKADKHSWHFKPNSWLHWWKGSNTKNLEYATYSGHNLLWWHHTN
jgi:hypothetical protein